jgi:hypothetical protein
MTLLILVYLLNSLRDQLQVLLFLGFIRLPPNHLSASFSKPNKISKSKTSWSLSSLSQLSQRVPFLSGFKTAAIAAYFF